MMRAGLLLSIFLTLLVSSFAAPIPYAESLRRLEELSGKLKNFESELKEDENGQSESARNLSPADQALIDKYKSKQDPISATLNKETQPASSEDAEVEPEQEQQLKRDSRVFKVYKALSPEEQALLDKYKSKQPITDALLLKPGTSEGSEDAELPEEEQARNLKLHHNNKVSSQNQGSAAVSTQQRRSHQAFNDYLSDLSEENQQLLKRHMSKMIYLNHAADKQAKRSKLSNRGLTPLEDGEKLSPQDQALLDKYKSKQPEINGAIQAHHDTAADEGSAAVPTQQRRSHQAFNDYLNDLSEENQQLLKRHMSKMIYLNHAAEKQAKRSKLSNRGITPLEEQKSDEKLAQLEQSLSPEDIELLKNFKSKLQYLKEAIAAKRPTQSEEESASQGDAEAVPDDEAGPLEERREAKMDGWNEQPLSGAQLGLDERCPCDKDDGENSKRCACDKVPPTDLQERCPRCHDNDAIIRLLEEKCPNCHGDKTPDKVLEEVEERLMNDLAYAQENGISVAELIKAVRAKNAASNVLNEESELEALLP